MERTHSLYVCLGCVLIPTHTHTHIVVLVQAAKLGELGWSEQ